MDYTVWVGLDTDDELRSSNSTIPFGKVEELVSAFCADGWEIGRDPHMVTLSKLLLTGAKLIVQFREVARRCEVCGGTHPSLDR